MKSNPRLVAQPAEPHPKAKPTTETQSHGENTEKPKPVSPRRCEDAEKIKVKTVTTEDTAQPSRNQSLTADYAVRVWLWLFCLWSCRPDLFRDFKLFEIPGKARGKLGCGFVIGSFIFPGAPSVEELGWNTRT